MLITDSTLLGASVGLVFAVLGPPSAHCSHHDAVHVEPGLTQRCGVGLTQTALEHVQKRLAHHLTEWRQAQNHFPSKFSHTWNCSGRAELWDVAGPYSERLRADSHCLMLPPKVEQKVLQGVEIIQVVDSRINHKHDLWPQRRASDVNCTNTCGGHGGTVLSPWWHDQGTPGWKGSLVWSHSLCYSWKDLGVRGPAQTV